MALLFSYNYRGHTEIRIRASSKIDAKIRLKEFGFIRVLFTDLFVVSEGDGDKQLSR